MLSQALFYSNLCPLPAVLSFPSRQFTCPGCRRLTAAGSRVESAARGSLPPSKYLRGKSEPADKYHGHWITEKNTRKFAEHWWVGEGKD